MDFPPILILAIIWLLIGLPLSKLNKKAKPNPTKPGPKTQQARPDKNYTDTPQPARPSVMKPTITVTEHDDSVYQGSLNAVTGEGYDPCHDEQLAPLTFAETAAPAAETAEPGLHLSWTGSDIVRGVVMSEILTRRKA